MTESNGSPPARKPSQLFGSALLILGLTTPCYGTHLELHYDAYLLHMDDSFSSLIANPREFGHYQVGCVRVTITLEDSFRSAWLQAHKTQQTIAKSNTPRGKSHEAKSTTLDSITTFLVAGLRLVSTFSTSHPDSDTEEIDATQKGFEDLGSEQAQTPVPESDSLNQLATLYGFFLKAPIGSSWNQHESEAKINDIWQLFRKSYDIIHSHGRIFGRDYLPGQQSHQTQKAQEYGASLSFQPGRRPLLDIVGAGGGCEGGVLDAQLQGYFYYIPEETKKRTTIPVFGLASLYELTVSGLSPRQVLGWFPELLPTNWPSATLYGYSGLSNVSQSLHLSDLFRDSRIPYAKEFSLSQSGRHEYFYIFSEPTIDWHTLLWQVGNHRLVLVQSNRSFLRALAPATPASCLLSDDDLSDTTPVKQDIIRQ